MVYEYSLSSKGHNSHKNEGIKISCQYAKHVHMMFYLHTKFHDKWISSFRGVEMTRSFISIFLVPRDITPTKRWGWKFPADMHNTIWCPIYIPSFMKIRSVVSEELRWQGHLRVFSLSSKGHNSNKKMRGSKFPADMHKYIWCPIYIPSYMILNWISSFRGVAMTRFWDGRTE